jgi:ArsR family transcriptional regulator, arsenate/arsenite/antimonite-responsive transcriptional repressor
MRQASAQTTNQVCVTAEEAHAEFHEAAGLFKALADEARLAILSELRRRGEICACDLLGCCGLSQPTVSYHLKVLREAGLVTADKRGSWVYYRLNEASLRALHGLLP